MIIRAARPADWPNIYPFFARIVADGQSYSYPEGLSLDEARDLWMKSAPSLTVVAVDGGEAADDKATDDKATGAGTILGSATMGPNRPGRGSHVATGSFMVDPNHGGRGVGRALGEYLIRWARDQGYHSIQFNAVVQTNTVATALWQSLGFEILATVPEAFDHAEYGLVGLQIMYLRL